IEVSSQREAAMSRSTSSAFRTGFTFACIVFFAALAHAQYRTSIQGSVTDSTGAVVPGANLTLTNPTTGEKQVRDSNGDGVYNFNALPDSVPFRLEVERQGFLKKGLGHLQVDHQRAN